MQINHSYILKHLYPDESWDYDALSTNINTTEYFVSENLDKPWNYSFTLE